MKPNTLTITEILSGDTLFIPKTVFSRDDIYIASKFLFAAVFTDCLKSIAAEGRTAETIGQMMKKKLLEMTIPEIQFECFCNEVMASSARREVVSLINHTNIAACLRETEVR